MTCTFRFLINDNITSCKEKRGLSLEIASCWIPLSCLRERRLLVALELAIGGGGGGGIGRTTLPGNAGGAGAAAFVGAAGGAGAGGAVATAVSVAKRSFCLLKRFAMICISSCRCRSMSLMRFSALDCAEATKAATLSFNLLSGFGCGLMLTCAAAVTGCTGAACTTRREMVEYC